MLPSRADFRSFLFAPAAAVAVAAALAGGCRRGGTRQPSAGLPACGVERDVPAGWTASALSADERNALGPALADLPAETFVRGAVSVRILCLGTTDPPRPAELDLVRDARRIIAARPAGSGSPAAVAEADYFQLRLGDATLVPASTWVDSAASGGPPRRGRALARVGDRFLLFDATGPRSGFGRDAFAEVVGAYRPTGTPRRATPP